MNTYTTNNPPKRGNARRIWDACKRNGINITELHYNANCWGHGATTGLAWGMWGIEIDGRTLGLANVIKETNQVYIVGLTTGSIPYILE